ncbi:vesicle-associated membrane protein 724 isoform X1 [Brassica rapa]|uniref:vesicle-associated membrane protein 724-like n=1 Tax=Brassica napus TaxID=3708 RepID=UPI00142E4658|nr:vesicle-associated membrane protein 724 isoform X1 [Brassica rapa]XP_048594599.1 vesicle-associated membrane protein 724-like [Brassica napus]
MERKPSLKMMYFFCFTFSAYCVVAKDALSKQTWIAFLERVKADFKKRYGGGKASAAIAKSLNKEFMYLPTTSLQLLGTLTNERLFFENCRPVMKEHMKYIVDHAEEIEKLIKVKAQVSEVKSIMLENIDKAIDRGENLTVLSDKTENLRSQAQEYKKQGTQVRRKLWYQNMKIKLVVLGILLLHVLIIWLSICHGFDCTD